VFLQALASVPNTTVSPSPQPAIDAIGHAMFSLPVGVQDLAHVPLYAVLGALWCHALRAWAEPTRSTTAAVVLSALLGTLIELSQIGVPGRVCGIADAVVNIAAATLGVLVLSSPIPRRVRQRMTRARMPT
jgi:VanZ family protein